MTTLLELRQQGLKGGESVKEEMRRNLLAKLVKMGIQKMKARTTVYSNRNTWFLSHTNAVEKAYTNDWFERMGLIVISNKKLEHWFETSKWVKLA